LAVGEVEVLVAVVVDGVLVVDAAHLVLLEGQVVVQTLLHSSLDRVLVLEGAQALVFGVGSGEGAHLDGLGDVPTQLLGTRLLLHRGGLPAIHLRAAGTFEGHLLVGLLAAFDARADSIALVAFVVPEALAEFGKSAGDVIVKIVEVLDNAVPPRSTGVPPHGLVENGGARAPEFGFAALLFKQLRSPHANKINDLNQ
jgi:hypothetical protein